MPVWSGRRGRRAAATWLACSALVFAACSGGGSGGDGATGGAGGAPPPPPDDSAQNATAVHLAWEAAEGPVAGYAVYVSRDGGAFDRETDVKKSRVTLKGEPGQRGRVIVAAFDAQRRLGPPSPPSPEFTFPGKPAHAGGSESGGAASPADGTASSGSGQGSSGAAHSGDTAEDHDGDAADPAPFDPAALAGALVWQAGDAVRLTDAALETLLEFARPAADAQLAVVADFDGDGLGDLAWIDAQGAVAYTPTASLDPAAEDAPVVDVGTLEPGARVLGAGDLDGDGYGDLVVLRGGQSVDAWFPAPGAATRVALLGSVLDATLVGVGDFDGSGTDDLAWRRPDGALVISLLDRGRLTGGPEIPLAADLEVVGVGDFDASGADALALRDPSGAVFTLVPLAEPAALAATDLAGAQAWQSAGAGDLDGDGSDELVLVSGEAVRIAGLPGDETRPLEPGSPWALVSVLR